MLVSCSSVDNNDLFFLYINILNLLVGKDIIVFWIVLKICSVHYFGSVAFSVVNKEAFSLNLKEVVYQIVFCYLLENLSFTVSSLKLSFFTFTNGCYNVIDAMLCL